MSSNGTPNEARHTNGRKLFAFIALAAAAGIVAYFASRPNTDELLQRAQSAAEAGDATRALSLAERVLVERGDDPNALVIAGDACFSLSKFDRALEFYRRVSVGSSATSVHAQFRCGRIEMHHTGNVVAAEAHFREALKHRPDDKNGLFQLASILGIQGRRREAVPLILRWFRLGEFHRDFLTLISDDGSALYNLKELQRYRDASPEHPAILTGLAWHARKSGRDEEAANLLRRALELNAEFTEARVCLAELYWGRKQIPALISLLKEGPSRNIDDSRLWIVRGLLAKRGEDIGSAMRCFWEALQKDPSNRTATYELFRYVLKMEGRERSEPLRRRLDDLQRLRERTDVVESKTTPDIDAVRKLSSQLVQLGRLWEAWGWCQVVQRLDPKARWAADQSAAIHKRLQRAELSRVCVSSDLNVDLSGLPLPEQFAGSPRSTGKIAVDHSTIAFRDDAAKAGVTFRFNNSPSKIGMGQRMYEFNGGGCAVLDYDNDGWPDLLFTQGCRWPVDSQRFDDVDRLYKNSGDGRYRDVTLSACLAENRFSAGVTVGDFDNDGFDDLYIANNGQNRLYHNNGDGTFEDVSDEAGVGDPRWSTSCVMADLNGDGFPDLYSVNYLEGPTIFQDVCEHKDGRPRMCMPFDYPGAQDQLFINQGNGQFLNATQQSGVKVPNGKGLGVVVADWEGKGRLGIFVANDTVPNSLFINRGSQANGIPRFENRAMAAGVALNAQGKAEGCMGIAAGDVNGDGYLDLYVTNFYQETNTLFMSRSGAAFDDVTRRTGLAGPSLPMLGFGAQFLDADLDGHLDLLVTNGHIDDYRPYGRPYKMPPQFYRNRGKTRFVLADMKKQSPYFSGSYLGRSLALLDWNRDGCEDALITHLDEPAALLTNITKPCGNFLALRFRGVLSARDAVGTKITLHTDDGKLIRQLTAGDGYQASNERCLIFGLGKYIGTIRIDVRWPSGKTTSIPNLESNNEYLLIEDRKQPLRLPR